MPKEAAPVIGEMKVKKDYTYCGKRIVKGVLYGKKIAVVVCGVGKVNAASGTQYAIDRLHADKIINLGVAGGLNSSMEIGGIYAASAVVQYDYDVTQLNGTAIGTLNECTENYLPLCAAEGFVPKKAATGDRFNDSREDFLLLTQTLGADVRDMELGAIAQVCMHAKVPCCSFKIISDLAGSGSTTDQYLGNLKTCFSAMKNNLAKIISAV